jgi:hypothetical protein
MVKNPTSSFSNRKKQSPNITIIKWVPKESSPVMVVVAFPYYPPHDH